MKKTMMLTLFVFVLALAISLIAYAGATRVEFTQGPGAVGDHEDASGFVIWNETPKGATITVIQIQVRDAAANFTYYVWSNQESRGSFTTNKKGSGNFHLNLSPDDTPLGYRIGIRWSDEISKDPPNMVLVTPLFPW